GTGFVGKVTVASSAEDDQVTLTAGAATVDGATYVVSVQNAHRIEVHGGGGRDQLTLNDSPGNDTIVLTDASASLRNTAGAFVQALGAFARVTAVHSAGGADTVRVYGGAGADKVVMTPTYTTVDSLTTDRFCQVVNFPAVYAYGQSGEGDQLWA